MLTTVEWTEMDGVIRCHSMQLGDIWIGIGRDDVPSYAVANAMPKSWKFWKDVGDGFVYTETRRYSRRCMFFEIPDERIR